MPDGQDPATIKILGAIGDISAADWDRCAGLDDPFVTYAFLSALEDSGSVSAQAGWHPRHMVLEDGQGQIAAVVPLYLKSHSYGEYIFDWNWADAYQRSGGAYYPKLQAAVPFTPVTGRRLLIDPDLPAAARTEIQRTLLKGLVQLTEDSGVSSCHLTFINQQEWQLCGDVGLLQRIDRQFHWLNEGYRTFDDFLATLTSRKRKSIRRERKGALQSGLTIGRLTGAQIKPRHWDAFYGFYRDTSERKWGQAYLNREFFDLLGQRLADKVMLVMAEDGGDLVGGALNMIGAQTLFGRYWGCLDHYKFLHFEACYYQAIEFAIENGLGKVEAGAQGQHKLQRGYLPHTTYSAHWIADPGFRKAVSAFLVQERDAVGDEIDALTTYSPFKSND
ncbi:MAG TPA: N-acetyltransferase [Rhodospirillales bacterium]|nr:N-acetyltransferase [Rhodospirillales bacterium]